MSKVWSELQVFSDEGYRMTSPDTRVRPFFLGAQ